MPLFLSDEERAAIGAARRQPQMAGFYWALMRRVETRAAKPGLLGETADWWRPVAEYLTDAALAHALNPGDAVAAWLRDVTLALVRRPQDDWVGPPYRDHRVLDDGSQIGHLETGHICWAIAIVLDLADDVFTDAERDEVRRVLRERGLTMCRNWLDRPHSVANWWCVLTAGLTVAAAVLDDEPMLARARQELAGCRQILQADGSYGESLQYANYAIYTLILSSEALRRRGEDVAALVPIDGYAGYARWAAASYLYCRPTPGWGAAPKPRSLNFNDSGAVFKPSADLLLHLASRGQASHPTEAGLARWLFEQTYASFPAQGPHDQASFGLRNDWGFLTLVLLPSAAEPLAPAAAGLDPTLAFDCGNSIARDVWGGRTVLGMHGGGEPLNGPGHLHHDLNTIILVHNDQRLLTDAGHSCYRNTLRRLEVATETHNTCIFRMTATADERMEAWASDGVLQQREPSRRVKRGDDIGVPIHRGARRLMAAQLDDVRVLGSDAAESYGRPIERFARFAILCGSHAVFIVDHIVSADPVVTQWHWLLNNRDGELDLKIVGTDRIVARRGDAGMKLFSLIAGGRPQERWAHVNDAYHCMPSQMGEGRPGSAVLLQWSEPRAATERVGVHAIALDGYGTIAGWHLRQDNGAVALESPDKQTCWALHADAEQLTLTERGSGRVYIVAPGEHNTWALRRK